LTRWTNSAGLGLQPLLASHTRFEKSSGLANGESSMPNQYSVGFRTRNQAEKLLPIFVCDFSGILITESDYRSFKSRIGFQIPLKGASRPLIAGNEIRAVNGSPGCDKCYFHESTSFLEPTFEQQFCGIWSRFLLGFFHLPGCELQDNSATALNTLYIL
jgi:hypothetical protein